MKAAVINKYGPPEVLEVIDINIPKVNNNAVLINIKAAAVNSTDPSFRKGDGRIFTGVFKPHNLILGDSFSGEVVEIGKDVTKFKIGEKVYGASGTKFGSHAEFIALSETAAITVMPDSFSYEEAAGIVDGSITAIHFLRDLGKIKKEQKVLIYGASGSVGTAAVQLAKYFETEVTAVCSISNLELVKSIGANFAIDYKKDDFTKDDKKYDIIFDTVGKLEFSTVKESLTTNGVYLSTMPSLSILTNKFFGNKIGKKANTGAAGLQKNDKKIADLNFVTELANSGKIKTVIDRVYKLDEISEAHKYVEEGHKKGNVVIII